eukprot:CAMPEP_0174716124 /NCGR_PEP_ID=MMETSP1094-20130205/22939_1 /TAXON_ID=156173 /ORGANISM="Chrysochromulina brevifilum, Strain UTEX LB 985" /LENGTH=90 /DNA_ID=CAMNT_0015915805 /DNA_START=170 /DNA_END=442 /DNA_ORIENTATION=+
MAVSATHAKTAPQMLKEVASTVSDAWCNMFRTHEIPEDDPSLCCWLADEDVEDENSSPEEDGNSSLEYICVQEHPCLDTEDGFDHSEDSY